jgi:hypothetical protein
MVMATTKEDIVWLFLNKCTRDQTIEQSTTGARITNMSTQTMFHRLDDPADQEMSPMQRPNISTHAPSKSESFDHTSSSSDSQSVPRYCFTRDNRDGMPPANIYRGKNVLSPPGYFLIQ